MAIATILTRTSSARGTASSTLARRGQDSFCLETAAVVCTVVSALWRRWCRSNLAFRLFQDPAAAMIEAGRFGLVHRQMVGREKLFQPTPIAGRSEIDFEHGRARSIERGVGHRGLLRCERHLVLLVEDEIGEFAPLMADPGMVLQLAMEHRPFRGYKPPDPAGCKGEEL
jgi:hypothetical protein